MTVPFISSPQLLAPLPLVDDDVSNTNVLPRVPDPHVCEQAPHALQEPKQLLLLALVLVVLALRLVLLVLLVVVGVVVARVVVGVVVGDAVVGIVVGVVVGVFVVVGVVVVGVVVGVVVVLLSMQIPPCKRFSSSTEKYNQH